MEDQAARAIDGGKETAAFPEKGRRRSKTNTCFQKVYSLAGLPEKSEITAVTSSR